MALGKGIPVINGFDLNSKLPLDSRAVADTMEDMNALITNGSVGDGQLCYCKADKKLYVLKEGKWEEVGGSTSPILNLLDWSSEDPVVRTSITEEEKQNIEKGLYNSVLYIDASLGGASFYSIYFSEPASNINGTFIFSIYKFSLDETTESGSITSLRVYGLNIGEKNPDETYPITIESLMEFPFGSGSSNLPVIVKKAINNKVTITEDEFDKLASGKYSLSVFSTDSSGFTSSLIFTDVAVKALSEGKPDNIRAISSSIVFNDPIIVQQDYRLNFSRNNLVSDITSSFTPMTQSKLLNKKVMTYGTFTSENLLPCTTADNGKVLSVVDGEAQWASAGGGIPVIEGTESATTTDGAYTTYTIPEAQTSCFIFKCDLGTAFVSYNAAFETYNGYLDAEGDVTDGSLKLNDLIVLSGSGTTIDIFFGNIGGSGGSGLPVVQATLSGNIGEIKTYTIPEKQTSPFILSIDGNYVLISVSASGDDYYGEYYYQYKYYYISGGDTSILLRENTSFVIGSKIVPLFTDYNILIDKQSSRTEILPCTTADNGKVLSVVNGEAQWASAGGGVTVTFED